MRKGDNTDIDRYRDTEDTQEGYIHIDRFTHIYIKSHTIHRQTHKMNTYTHRNTHGDRQTHSPTQA